MGEVLRLQPMANFILRLIGNLHLKTGFRFQVKLGQMLESQRLTLWEQPLLAKFSGSTTLNEHQKLEIELSSWHNMSDCIHFKLKLFMQLFIF
jgi:hypothetical protein